MRRVASNVSKRRSQVAIQQAVARSAVVEQLEQRQLLSANLVYDLNTAAGIGAGATGAVSMNGTYYFAANDGTNGVELWKSDGTSAGTSMVKDIVPGSGSSNPLYLTAVNGTLYFQAVASTGGTKLWKSDGTAAGTVIIAMNQGAETDVHPGNLTDVNGTLFFSAFAYGDGVGYELYKLDTAGVPRLVYDVNPGLRISSNPSNLTNVNGTLFFTATNATYGTELWKTDGTSAGTAMVADLVAGTGSSSISGLVNVNGTLYFAATDGTTGVELYKAVADAGSPTGWTVSQVKDINPAGNSSPTGLTNVNGTLFFAANDGTNGVELWTSDGTDAGTMMVTNLNSGSANSNPTNLTNVNGTLFFPATDGSAGVELYNAVTTTDTVTYPSGWIVSQVADINPGSTASTPTNLTAFNGVLFFAANDGTNGVELHAAVPDVRSPVGWSVLHNDINPGAGSSSPSLLRASGLYGEQLLMFADDGTNGAELMKLSSDFSLTPGITPAPPTLAVTFTGADITAAEYFIDGIGADDGGIDLTGTFGGGSVSLSNPLDSAAFAALSEGVHAVYVHALDNGTWGTMLAAHFVKDTAIPSITNMSVPADGTYLLNQNLNFTLTFGEPVTVTGSPYIPLTIGTAARQASYLSTNGNTLTFRYTLQEGDLDSDGIAVTSPVALNGGAIVDAASNAANLAFSAPATNAVLVEATSPAIASLQAVTSPRNTAISTLDVTFSEPIKLTTFTYADLSLTRGGTAVTITGLTVTSVSDSTYRINGLAALTATAGNYVLTVNGSGITDLAGNASSGSVQSLWTVDTAVPTIPASPGVSSTAANGTYDVGAVIPITVAFSEAVYVTGTPTLTLETGPTDAVVNYTSGSGTSTLTFEYTVAAGNNRLDLNYVATTSLALPGGATIKDAAGNNATTTLPAVTAGTAGNLATNKDIVIDTAPIVSSITVTAGNYKAAGNIDIVVNFSEPVDVAPVTGTRPRLQLDVGGATKYANYQSGTGTSAITFRYTVVAGDNDANGIDVISPVDPNTGSLRDRDGTIVDAVLTFTPSPLNFPNVKVDTVVPTVLSVTSTAADGTYAAGSVIPITITFSEPVNVSGTPTLQLETGPADVLVNYASGSGTTVLTFNYTVGAGDSSLDLNYLATNSLTAGTYIRDPAANNATRTLPALASPDSLGGSKNLIISNPMALMGFLATDGSYRATQTIPITLYYSQPVTVAGGTPTLTLGNGATATYASGSGTTGLVFNYIVAAGQDTGASELDVSALNVNSATFTDASANPAPTTIPAMGAAGSLAANANVFIDTVAPTVTITTRNSNGDVVPAGGYTNVNPMTIYFNFSESVGTTFVIGDITQVTGTKGATLTTVTAGLVYSCTWTPDTALAVLSIIASKFNDTAGNQNATTGNVTFNYENTPPAAPSITSIADDTGSSSTDGITNDATLLVNGSAEANAKVTVLDGTTTLGTTTASSSGAWTYTTAALSDGVHQLSATATDAAGNTGSASTTLAVTVDTTIAVPVVTGIADDTDPVGDHATDDTTLHILGTAEAGATVTVSEATAGVLGTAVANSAGAWDFDYGVLTTLAAGSYSFSASISDVAGNTATSSGYAVTVGGVVTPPVAPVITGFAGDSGTVGDFLTNDNTPTLSGTAENNSTVTVYDGTTLLGTTTAASDGAWSYTTAVLGDGAQSFTATATNGFGTGDPSTALNLTIDTVAPHITGVYVRGTAANTWGAGSSSGFLTPLATANGSATAVSLGYKIPSGATQSKSLPWQNINQISITFDEDPVDPIATAQMILSGGAQGVGDPDALDDYVEGVPTWNASLHALTWTLGGNITKDKLRINLNQNLTDAAGNALDGEWIDGTSTISGGGGAGGVFRFRFNVLPGDADQNGTVQAVDWNNRIRAALGTTAAGGGLYTIFKDINANAVIQANDWNNFSRVFLGNQLPVDEPESLY